MDKYAKQEQPRFGLNEFGVDSNGRGYKNVDEMWKTELAEVNAKGKNVKGEDAVVGGLD